MKNTLLLAMSVTFCVPSFAQYDPEALAVLDAMSEKYQKADAFKAVFTQKLTNKQANLNESLSGKIIIKENKYILDIAGQKIFNTGKDIYTYNEELSEITISPNDTEDNEITISNVYDLYKEGFKYTLVSIMTNGDRVIELSPESRDKSYFKITLIISSQNELKSFTVYEQTNNIYTYSIDAYEEISVKDSFFTFDISKYPNVEVIDFR